jgi:MoaA/NifB/PqqE/SkfB family radical SAM enzyme
MSAQHGFSTSSLLEANDDRIVAMPILVLNAHSRCNCRCVMCDIWKRPETNEIKAADLERHRESIRALRVEWVVISGGEPLMHSDLPALCNFFRELNIRLTLLTTGVLLSRRAAEVATLFDDVIVSLDGPREIHDSIRRVRGSFDLIASGLGELRKIRARMHVTARTTVQKMNHAHLRETVLSAKELGLEGISFLAADVTSEAFNRPLLWPEERQSEIALSADEVRVLEIEVDELIASFAEDIRRGYIAESPAKLRRIVTHFRAQLGELKSESPKCNAPWVSAVIEPDGKVRPCFFHRAVGSIHEVSLDEIVNGEAARTFRRQLKVAENPICQRCVCSLYHPGPDNL